MFRPRIIPTLLLSGKGLVKSVKFKNHKYVGDPINAVRIFNEKLADELIFLDIRATDENRKIPLALVSRLSDECFMPFSAGGGISHIKHIRDIIKSGAEKVIINSAFLSNPDLVTQGAEEYGTQSIVISIDVKKNFWGGYEVVSHGGRRKTGVHPVEHVQLAENKGAGEIFINSVDQDGTMNGYDLQLIRMVSDAVSIPVIASGGAGSFTDFAAAVYKGGASATAAGSIFVFRGRHRAVLIDFPTNDDLKELFQER